MFFKSKKKDFSSPFSPSYVIVGLGNPGGKYDLTRHNVGFMFIDRLADKIGCDVKKLKFKALYGDGKIDGVRVLLVKPQTFMNNSGEAVRDIMNFYKIPADRLIVVYDDVALDVGKLRIRKKGSDGGHNGIKSIIYLTGHDDFLRLRVAIGPKPHPDTDLADFVLGRVRGEEEKKLADAIDRGVEAVKLMVKGETDRAMNLYNG